MMNDLKKNSHTYLAQIARQEFLQNYLVLDILMKYYILYKNLPWNFLILYYNNNWDTKTYVSSIQIPKYRPNSAMETNSLCIQIQNSEYK